MLILNFHGDHINVHCKHAVFVLRACLFISVRRETLNSGNIVLSVSNTDFYCLLISFFCVSQLCRSAIPGKKKMASYSLKVTRAEREGMKIINPTRQTYINVTDSTACVPFIVAQCREDFDDDSLELDTANGLAIEDSESTRGISICTSRLPFRTFPRYDIDDQQGNEIIIRVPSQITQ